MSRLFVCLVLSFGLSSADAADTLRVATFNINYANLDLPDIQRAIQSADADLVCLQETSRGSEQFLKREFKTIYPHIVFMGYRGRFAAERFGFLSKRPLKEVHYDPPVDGLFGTYFCTINHNKRSVRIVNVHMSPFTVRRGSSVRQAFQAMSAVESIHQKEIRRIVARLDTRPTVVCGDFNSLSTFVAPKELMKVGFVDSFASVTKNADTQVTWRWPVGKLFLQFRIDYLFHTSHFTTISSRIVPTTGSDHFLVVSEFALKPRKPGKPGKPGKP